ncbi:unnamed protein product [Lota lota]
MSPLPWGAGRVTLSPRRHWRGRASRVPPTTGSPAHCVKSRPSWEVPPTVEAPPIAEPLPTEKALHITKVAATHQ